MTFKVGDPVRVLRSRVHPYDGKVIGLLPVNVRVEFDRGGYGGVGYIEAIQPNRLELIQDHKTNADAPAATNPKGN